MFTHCSSNKILIFITNCTVNSSETGGRGLRDVLAWYTISNDTPFKAPSVAGRHTIRTIDLLKDSSLEQVLLVLNHNASFCHYNRVWTHILQV
jgi:hypothetical protein